jgi:hypothetical protein
MTILTTAVFLTPLRRSRLSWVLLVLIGIMIASVYLPN